MTKKIETIIRQKSAFDKINREMLYNTTNLKADIKTGIKLMNISKKYNIKIADIKLYSSYYKDQKNNELALQTYQNNKKTAVKVSSSKKTTTAIKKVKKTTAKKTTAKKSTAKKTTSKKTTAKKIYDQKSKKYSWKNFITRKYKPYFSTEQRLGYLSAKAQVGFFEKVPQNFTEKKIKEYFTYAHSVQLIKDLSIYFQTDQFFNKFENESLQIWVAYAVLFNEHVQDKISGEIRIYERQFLTKFATDNSSFNNVLSKLFEKQIQDEYSVTFLQIAAIRPMAILGRKDGQPIIHRATEYNLSVYLNYK